MIETLAHGCSSESTQYELFNEYQNDRVKIVFKNLFASLCLDESSLSSGRARVTKTDFTINDDILK